MTPAEALRAAADRLTDNAAVERVEAPFGPWLLMDPDFADPLAAWLREEAADEERAAMYVARMGLPNRTAAALDLARAVLGETAPSSTNWGDPDEQ